MVTINPVSSNNSSEITEFFFFWQYRGCYCCYISCSAFCLRLDLWSFMMISDELFYYWIFLSNVLADTEGMARKLRETEDLLQAVETEKQSAESQVIHVITLCWWWMTVSRKPAANFIRCFPLFFYFVQKLHVNDQKNTVASILKQSHSRSLLLHTILT